MEQNIGPNHCDTGRHLLSLGGDCQVLLYEPFSHLQVIQSCRQDEIEEVISQDQPVEIFKESLNLVQ